MNYEETAQRILLALTIIVIALVYAVGIYG